MDRLEGMGGVRALPVVAAVVAVLAVLVLGAGLLPARSPSTAATAGDLPPQPVAETVTLSPFLDGVDDGLNRLVVGVDLATAVAAAPPPPTPATDVWLNDADDPQHLDRDDLSDADAELLRRLHGGGTVTAVPAHVPDVADVMATIAAVDGVEDVMLADPDHIAVATSLTGTDLATLPGVGTVQTDHLRTIASMDFQPHQWALANPDLPSADIRWAEANAVADGTGVVVAVIDTGIDTSHPDLADQMWTNDDEVCGNGVDDDGNGYVDDCLGWDFANEDPSVDDGDTRHGTHVAGIIAADHDAHGVTGVAPGAVVMPLKVSHDGSITASRLARAIDYAVDNGADVINMSLAGYGSSPVEVAACARADAAGVVMVAAMGNDGADVTATPTYPAALDLPSMIAVASSDDRDAQAGHSNHSATLADVHAPGQRILSAFPDLRLAYLSGTSMATPNVAGVAALVVQRGARGAAVRRTIMDSAMPRPSLAGRSVTGARLDAASAVGVPAGDVTVVVGSVHDVRAGVPDVATVQVTGAPAALAGEQTDVALSLGRVHGGSLYAVTGLPITAGGTTGTTDGDGRVVIGAIGGQSGAGLSTTAAWTLPGGSYVMVVEVMDPRPDQPALATHVISFDVTTGPAATSPAPGDPVPGDPAAEPAPSDTPDGDVPSGEVPSDEVPSDDLPSDGDPVVGDVDPGPVTPVPGSLTPDDAAPADAAPADAAPDPADTAPADPAAALDGPTPDGPVDDGPVDDATTSPAPDAMDDVAPDPGPGAGGSDHASGSPTTPEGAGQPAAPRPERIDGSVFPATGRPEGGTMATVSVPAGVPDGAYVRFGENNANLISAGTTAVTVQVPAHAVGPVDVTILVPDGRRLVLPAAFTYVDDTPAPTPAPATPDSPTPGGTVLVTPVPDRAPDQGPDQARNEAPADPTVPEDGGAPDGNPSTPPPAAGGAITIDGLTLTPPTATSALSGISTAVLPGARCASASCTAVAV